jgi:aryl-phospho-beta-D-glucosidase BglC (GH1 family)
MWQKVAAYLCREPNLLGYELINEPIGANLYHSIPDVIVPGQANNKYLLPAYTKIYNAIRTQDPTNLIFYEPSTTDIFSGGFYETIGGESEKSKQVFSYHIYCPDVTAQG